MSDECRNCGEPLVTLPQCSEPEGYRADRYCGACDTKYACHKHGLEEIEVPKPDYYPIIGRQQVAIEALTQERDRYREALEHVQAVDYLSEVREIAQTALEGGESEYT